MTIKKVKDACEFLGIKTKDITEDWKMECPFCEENDSYHTHNETSDKFGVDTYYCTNPVCGSISVLYYKLDSSQSQESLNGPMEP
jgi:hypothetical protein